MARSPFTVEGFGGLNLRDDPYAVGAGGCTACLDIEPSPARRIIPRPGFQVRSYRTPFASTTAYAFLHPLPDANRLLAVSSGLGEVITYDNAGTQVALNNTGSATSTLSYSAANIGGGTYVANGTSPRFIDSAGAITAPAFTGFTPVGACLAVTAKSYRLVANDGDHRVRFSDAGAPTVFGVNNWVDLDPQDGESIRSIVTWRDYTLVFKRTKVFVFYGESTDSTGQPIFDYRPVRGIAGLDYSRGNCVTVGVDGVFYLSRTGVYVTTGETPTKVSGVLDPIFTSIPEGASGTVFSAGKHAGTTTSAPALHWAAGRLYVAYPTGSGVGNDRMAVWDRDTGTWVLWKHDPGVTAITSQPIGSTTSTSPQLLIATLGFDQPASASDTLSAIKSLTDTTTCSDEERINISGLAATPFTWSYESGLYSLAEGQVAVTAESRMDGLGTATLQVATTGGPAGSSGAYDTGSAVTLGSTVVAPGWQEIDREGLVWQHKISGTGPAQIDRLVHYVSGVLPAGLQ